MTITRINDTGCPVCFTPMNGASPALGTKIDKPRPGSYGLCINCSAILIFETDETFREAKHEDLMILKPSDLSRLREAQRTVRAFKQRKSGES